MNKTVLAICSFFIIFLLISNATAVPTNHNRQIKNSLEKNGLKKNNDSSDYNRLMNFWNKTKAVFSYLGLTFRISLALMRWPFQGLYNVINYAHVQNHLFMTLINGFSEFSLNETLKIVFAFLILPFVGIWNIIQYAFIENHFFQILITDFINGLQQTINENAATVTH